MGGLYWLSDAEWRRIEPLLPKGRRGAHQEDDQRVISGVLHMLRCGGSWRDTPAAYGPYTTVYNRFRRWSREGVWEAILHALAGSSGTFGRVAVDPTRGKARAGAKGDPSGSRWADGEPAGRAKSTH